MVVFLLIDWKLWLAFHNFLFFKEDLPNDFN